MMRIVIFGGTGFIGKYLCTYFSNIGKDVIIVSRSKGIVQNSLIRRVTWKDLEENIEPLEGSDVFINLAGETINQRWTKKSKERILASRVDTTKKIIAIIARLKDKPKVLINGSAVGIYGMSDKESFDESSATSTEDFLAKVANEWEKEADACDKAVRLVKLRIGVVLGKEGGALQKMVLPYKLFAGGRIGTGNQWLSWIHIEDLARLIEFCILNDKMNGVVNATAPHPITNDEFGRTIARVLGRPHFLPVPSVVFKLLLGEMALMVLKGQKVLPKKVLDYGFNYNFPTIEKAIRDLLTD